MKPEWCLQHVPRPNHNLRIFSCIHPMKPEWCLQPEENNKEANAPSLYPSNEAGMVSATQFFSEYSKFCARFCIHPMKPEWCLQLYRGELVKPDPNFLYPSNEAGMVSATLYVEYRVSDSQCIHPMKPEWCLQRLPKQHALEACIHPMKPEWCLQQ